MLTVLTYLWAGEGRDFLPAHVTTQAANIRRHLSIEHRYVCITDLVDGFGAGVELLRTPDAAREVSELRNPEGTRFPSCYRRLWTFSREAMHVLGGWVLLLDVDAMLVKDLAPILSYKHDFMGWRPLATWGNQDRVGGGMWLLKTGSREHVWTKFAGQSSILEARRAGYRGSDQAWISYCLGRGCPTWPKSAGLYSIRDMRNGKLPLPDDARLVQFNGPPRMKPWNIDLPWVREHWR